MKTNIVLITTEIENRDMLNRVYKVEYNTFNNDVYVIYNGDEVKINHGEYEYLSEQEAKERLYELLMGCESTEISEVEELKQEVLTLEETIKDLQEYNEQLTEDVDFLGGL